MLEQEADCFSNVLLPALADHGIHLVDWVALTEEQRQFANQFFMANVFPVLTPLAMDPAHPFPYLSNLSTSLGVLLRRTGSEQPLFARLKVPSTLPQWVALESGQEDGDYVYLRVHELIQHNLHELFPGLEVVDTTAFRVTRDADVEPDDALGDSLREVVEAEIRQRRFEPVVRLELVRNPNPWVRDLLMQKFELGGGV